MKRTLQIVAAGLLCGLIILLILSLKSPTSTQDYREETVLDAPGAAANVSAGSVSTGSGAAGTAAAVSGSTSSAVPLQGQSEQTISRVKELEKMELDKRRRDLAAEKSHKSRVEVAVYKGEGWRKVLLTNREKFEALRKAAGEAPDKMVPCTICDGKGVLDTCVVCDHTGKCPTCKGTGEVGEDVCPTCVGTGKCFLCVGSGKMPCPYCQSSPIRKEVITPGTPDPPAEIPVE